MSAASLSDQQNLRAIGLMVFAMLCFAIEDSFIKFSAETIGVGQILFVLCVTGGSVFLALAHARGEKASIAILTEKTFLSARPAKPSALTDLSRRSRLYRSHWLRLSCRQHRSS